MPKKIISIPAPVATAGRRLLPHGKHAKGRLLPSGENAGIFLPGHAKAISQRADKKQAQIASSQRQGLAVRAREKEAQRVYREWFAGLSPEEKAEARRMNVDKYMPAEGFRRGPNDEDALAKADCEIIPHGSIRGTRNDKPIIAYEHEGMAAMEPEDLAVDVENLSPAEVRAASDDFATALTWALVAPAAASPEAAADPSADHHLVHLGKRSAVMIAAMRGDLGKGLVIETELARGLVAAFKGESVTAVVERLREAGAIYGRFLAWMREARTYSSLGEHLQLVAYELRPELIDQATMEKLGEAKNKTRQAKNKKANCFRDTFDGLRAFVQRPDITRLRCKIAQLCGGHPAVV